jgi:hypothetical protein
MEERILKEQETLEIARAIYCETPTILFGMACSSTIESGSKSALLFPKSYATEDVFNHAAGDRPICFLKALLKADSES